jgi:disulfide bond formation protein DsbB
VNVLYGTATGLSATGNQVWTQNSSGILDTAEAQDWFGRALTIGDFNADGFADLVIGVPNEDVGGLADAGAVNVLYGSATGLSATGNQVWNQDSPDILDTAHWRGYFGSALAVGDFNGDGFADLAVGVPGEWMGDPAAIIAGAGVVNVFYGSVAGLSATGNQVWHQDSPGILNKVGEGDYFGFALAAGDFNADSFTDLAIGVAREDIVAIGDAGLVNVLYGSATGLSATGNQTWHQDSSGIRDAAEVGDQFGYALAVGDFNGDGFADLAVGVNGEDAGAIIDAGAVNVLYGSATGLSATGNQVWHQDSSGIRDAAEAGDQFGHALAVGDFNGDGFADLAVGVNGEDAGAIIDTGAVNVLYSSATGLSATGNQVWRQDSSGIRDAAEEGDRFGYAVGFDNVKEFQGLPEN